MLTQKGYKNCKSPKSTLKTRPAKYRYLITTGEAEQLSFSVHGSLGHNGRLGLGSTVLLVRLEIFRYVFIIEVSNYYAKLGEF